MLSVFVILSLLNCNRSLVCIVVFCCGSIHSLLLTNCNEHLSLDLLPVHCSGQCMLKPFVHVLVGLFALLFLNCRNSLYILNTSP